MRIAISLNATDVDPATAHRAFAEAVRSLRKTSTGDVFGTFHAGDVTVEAQSIDDAGPIDVLEIYEIEREPAG